MVDFNKLRLGAYIDLILLLLPSATVVAESIMFSQECVKNSVGGGCRQTPPPPDGHCSGYGTHTTGVHSCLRTKFEMSVFILCKF